MSFNSDTVSAQTISQTSPSNSQSNSYVKPAVVLVNLGTPEKPTAEAVRPYLREFLSDRRVIEMSPVLWKPILEGMILRVRLKASAKKYASVWTDDGSPLMHWTIRQGEELAKQLGNGADVHIAMRYGKPALQDVLSELLAAGKRRVLVLPVYPQYAASSAGTVIDEVARWILKSRNQLELRTVRSFPDSPTYIDALASAVEQSWERNGRPDFEHGDKLVLSFHSIPLAMQQAGDPYRDECELTARLVRERLGLTDTQMLTRFQSVFGPAQWIGPATIDTMKELGKAGTKRVDVIRPGFMADCLETLEEIDQENREAFLNAGGQQFHYIPWANDSQGCIATLVEQARINLAGWMR
jgi:ferrochelatase